MKNNKRVTLPKSSSPEMEALIEVRRKRARMLYDQCIKKLGEGAEKGKDNLTLGEKRGLKSLRKRVAEGEIIICQTDKSGRFCVLSREQYQQAGKVHTMNDKKISMEEQAEIERGLNGHVRWWGAIWDLGSTWSQESRCLANLINHGLGTCPLTLLVKDHKSWSVIPKTRAVMGGNDGANSGISEFLSLVLEPVAKEQDGKLEINATNGLLADIADLNDELDRERRHRNISIHEEEISTPQEEEASTLQEELPTLQEAMNTPLVKHPEKEESKLDTTPCNPDSNQMDIRQFLVDKDKQKISFNQSAGSLREEDEPWDKNRVIRNKMVDARRAADKEEARESMSSMKPPMRLWNGEKVTHAKDVDNVLVQDGEEMVVVGADVEALYPSMVDVEIANIAYNAIMKSKISFQNINYRKALLYLAINMHKTDQRTSALWRILPRRTSQGGVRPGVTASPDKEDHWFFPTMQLTAREKRMVVAMVVRVGVLMMMNSHVYSWDGDNYLQKAGGPIGLRSTCAIARVVMNEWDARWQKMCADNNIKLAKGDRYVDDIRAFLKAIKMGWRWMEGSLYHTESWEEEDRQSGTSATKRTARVLVAMMNDVFGFLNFTTEIGDDFPDGKLPSLDVNIWVENGVILYEFYEKPMATNLMVEACSALSREVKMSTLSEEVARRLRNTSQRLNSARRMEILEEACVKMVTSGHTEEFARQAMENGIKAHNDRIRRSNLVETDPGFQPMFPKAGWRRVIRDKEKAMKRSTWYKGRAKEDCLEGVSRPGPGGRVMKVGRKKKSFQKDGKVREAATVIFVPSTRGSVLIKSLKEDEDMMAGITGFRVKYQEAGGSKLTNFFEKDLASGQQCGRVECPPCRKQEGRVNCKARNVVYESKCLVCNPSSRQEDEDSHPSEPNDQPREGIYIGETSRSLHERAVEHVRDAHGFSAKSHIVKHWMNSHPSLPSPPEMEFSISARYRDCLSRQIGEALSISNSKDTLLNSKAEYMANSLCRVTMKEDPWEQRERTRKEEEQEEMVKQQVEVFKKVKSTQQQNETCIQPANGGPCHQYGEGAPHKKRNTRASGLDVQCDHLSQPDVQGQPSQNDVQSQPSQHEVLYETDEDEFMQPDKTCVQPANGGPCHQYGVGAPQQKINTRARGLTIQNGYNLGYLGLWWRRMEREGYKDEETRMRKEEDDRRRVKIKSWLKTKKEKIRSMKNEDGGHQDVVLEDRQHQSTLSSILGEGRGIQQGVNNLGVLGREGAVDNAICERSQPNNGPENMYPDRQNTAAAEVSGGYRESDSGST